VRVALLACLLASGIGPTLAQDGSLDLASFRGRVVLVDFWASWCEPCRESFPWMAQLVERHGPAELVVVAVNVDEDRADADRFLAGKDWPFELVFDPEGRIAASFDLQAMPTTLLFDREGRLVGRHEGFHGSETGAYEQAVADAIAGVASPLIITTAGDRKRRVDPWERGRLAQPAMALDADPLDFEIDDHIYFSKEASSGGRSFGGGGCGCN
jgi:thiol-disulfide isomerase/thioredoxin